MPVQVESYLPSNSTLYSNMLANKKGVEDSLDISSHRIPLIKLLDRKENLFPRTTDSY